MSLVLSGQAINAAKQDLSKDAKSNLTKLAVWINDRNIPFLVTSIGMIVMLLWAGSYKMTAPGAEAIVLIAGYMKPKAGIIGGFITTLMFFITSTMVITTPGAIISVPGIHGMRYMSFLGLFLFKDVISLGVCFYLISYFGRKAILSEDRSQ